MFSPKAIVLTTKPRIGAKCTLYIKARLCAEDNILRENSHTECIKVSKTIFLKHFDKLFDSNFLQVLFVVYPCKYSCI